MKKILVIFGLILCITGCGKSSNNITIVSTSFPGYDIARAITKNSDIEVSMLLKPGAEMHDYEPTPKDIVDIKNSSLFIYVGGESDSWVDKIVSNLDLSKTSVIKLMDLVDLKEEELKEGMDGEDEDEYDEHIWTSPINAITITNKLKEEIIKIDNKEIYEKNSNEYVNKLKEIDNEFRTIVDNSKRKEIIFGDRFPFRYFTDEYNLDYYAAFKGCSDATEASAKTISFLINKVKSDNIPVIFKTELSSGKIANTISKETGAKVLEFNSAHNISKSDFHAGVTMVDIMEKNVSALKEALN